MSYKQIKNVNSNKEIISSFKNNNERIYNEL